MVIIENLFFHFGGLKAINGASFTINKGSITGLIGPNGAGKTTLFNIISGMLTPLAGRIIFEGEDVTGLKPHQLFAKGLLRTFQITQEFSSLTVRENLMMVPNFQLGESLINTWANRKNIAKQEKQIFEKASEIIDFLKLNELANEPAGNLSGGQKKLLELGRTMMVEAKIVLLDEVGAGVNPTLLNEIGETILKLKKEHGYTFCMIEHNIDFISKLCDVVIVMAEGKVLFKGSSDEVKSNDLVIEAYLGKPLHEEGTF